MQSTRYLIFLNLLVDTVSWSMCLPSMPYIYATFGLSDVSIGFLASFVSIVIFVFGAIQGKVSEYVGKISMLKMCASSQLVGHFVFILALRYKSFALFLVARCVPSMFKCGMVVSQALLYDISSEHDVSKNIATLMAFSNLSFIIGPVIGGFLYDWHPTYPFYVGLVISTLNLLLLGVLESVLVQPQSSGVEDVKGLKSPTSDHSNKSLGAYSNRPLARGIRFLRQRSYSINNAITTAITQSHTAHGNGKNKYSLLKYLHIRFAFQLNNSLLEALFSQHIKRTLLVSGSTVGQVMGFASVISALTNGFILKRLLATYPLPEKFLLPLVLSMTVGLYGWALSHSMWLLVLSVAITSVSSNLYLSITSSVIAQSQKVLERHKQSSSASSETNSTASGCLDGSGKDPLVVDTTTQDEVSEVTTRGRSRSSSSAARSPPMPVKLVLSTNTYTLPLVHSTVDLANTDSLGSELVVVDDQEIADPIPGGNLSPTSEGEDSGESTDYLLSAVEQEEDQRVQRRYSVSMDCTEGAPTMDEDVYVEIDALNNDEDSSTNAAGKQSDWVAPRLEAKLETIAEDEPASSNTAPAPPILSKYSTQMPVISTQTKSTSAMVFGLSSTTDRFARILTPTLGSLFFRFVGGSMGLVYLISIISIYCATLIVTTLPDRSCTIDTVESKDATLEKKLQ